MFSVGDVGRTMGSRMRIEKNCEPAPVSTTASVSSSLARPATICSRPSIARETVLIRRTLDRDDGHAAVALQPDFVGHGQRFSSNVFTYTPGEPGAWRMCARMRSEAGTALRCVCHSGLPETF